MEKYIKDGKVAVVRYSSYGQWSTKGKYGEDEIYHCILSREDRELLMFHPKIVQKVLDGKSYEITKEWLLKEFNKNFNLKDDGNLEIVWIPIGENFALTYDGEGESIVSKEDFFEA